MIDLDFVYDASGKLVGVDHGDEHYFYLRDVTGNIIGIVDRNGAYIVKYFYDAWGNILNENVIRSCAVSLLNPFKYKGCYVVEDDRFVKSYDPKTRNPYQVGMICFNEEELIVRYVFYSQTAGDISDDFSQVFFYSNCDWGDEIKQLDY